MMELFIETLTGAAFELRVSPFETIQSVKAKIQRLEGIPISQQHLIWQTSELDNDYCLHDYDIHSGATLKLVLAMRGGPINTRRVPVDDSPLVEYMESTPDDLTERLPGSRQVTLLVFREGDQLNFFRVVDRGDGTLTPLSESLSAASMYNMYDEEEEGDNGSKEKVEENARFKEKINLLKNKMVNLSVSKKTKSELPLTATAPNRLQTLPSAQNKPRSALNKNRCLPPVTSQKSVPISSSQQLSAAEHDYAKPRSQLVQQTANSTLTELTIPKPPAQPRSINHDISQRLHHQAGLLTSHTANGSDVAASSYSTPYSGGKTLRHAESETSFAALKKSDSTIKSIPENDLVTSHRSQAARSSATRVRRKEVMSLEKVNGSDTATSVAGNSIGSSAAPLYTRRMSSQQHEIRAASRQHADLTLESIKDSLYSQRITLESLSSNEAKMMSGFLQQASLEKLGSSSISNFSPVRTRKSSVPTYTNYHTMDDITNITSENGSRPIGDTLDGLSSSSKLPPVKSKKKGSKSSKRCFLCTKKTGLATSYMCRCGQNFCAAHRYAESHECTFDYKTEGRQLLEQNNPVVSAPKLPKI